MGEYSFGNALKGFLNKSPHSKQLRAIQIKDVWEQLMGVTIAKYTESIEIKGSTLFIQTSVAPLKNELHYQKNQIIARVNEVFKEDIISQVIIR